jgi:transposase InsO family protein
MQMVQRLERIEQRIPYYEGMIMQVRDIHPNMGLRTIYEKLQPEGIGRDHFIALAIRLGLCMDPITNRKRTTYVHRGTGYLNLLAGIDFTDVNQVWATDITYFKISDVFYYISLIMDLYSRRILGYFAADNMRAESSVQALKMALDNRGIENYDHTLIHHSDRGSQYVSDLYTDMLTDYEIRVSMCSSVYENTMQERVNRTIKSHYLKYWHIKNLPELNLRLKDAVFAYNYDKPHSALGKMSPVEYESYLQSVPLNERFKLQIHTNDSRNNIVDPNQILLF